MNKVNQLFQDELERRAEAYMAEHPDADPQDAHEAALRSMGQREDGE